MKLIIINGLPATGKTTLAKKLAAEIDMPVISKDAIKEFLFGEIGAIDRKWSQTLGAATSDFLWLLSDGILSYGKSVVLESNFSVDFSKPQLERLINRYDVACFEIYCHAESSIRRQRFVDRDKSGRRHKGHIDETYYQTLDNLSTHGPIGLGRVIRIDTTDPTQIDYKKILEFIT